jgi:multiple sugar transport system ATP-binding protein
MRMELKKLHLKMKTTTIYVTHDQIETMTLADRIVILKDGIIQQVGTPIDVFEKPESVFVARFIGNPPANILHGVFQRRKGAGLIAVGELAFPLPRPVALEDGQAVLVGQRTDNFLQAHDLATYVAQNKREWIDMHEMLAVRAMKEEECLPYVFEMTM